MSTFQIAYDPATRVATVQALNDALPVGSINVGTFDHVADEDDHLGHDVNHVFFHHVRDALYKRSAADPSELAAFPNNITDMHNVVIALDNTPNPMPINSVAPAITGDLTEGDTLTVTDGTWSASPTYARQWKRADTVDGVGTNIGAGATTYVLVAGDVGKYIYCDVTATNANGSNVAKSNVVGPILV